MNILSLKRITLIYCICYTGMTFAQADCNTDTAPSLDLTKSSQCILENKIKIAEPEINPELSYQENIKLRQSPQDSLEQAKENSANMDAFIQTHKFRKRDDTNAHDRHQHNLDNFRLPAFTCKLPIINTNRRPGSYSIDEISELNVALDEYHFCLNQAAETNREAFKYFIVHKLDGKILPSKGQRILWATLPEHQKQTQNIMLNINKLYDERYAIYLKAHNDLQNIIKNFNNKGQ